MINEKIIKIENITFSYSETDPPALTDVSLDIKRGEFVAVLGHNGSGKSTLAKTMNTILLPQKGTVLVNGMDTRDEENEYMIRQTVGMIFQNPDNQLVASIVEEDVAFAPENLGVPPKEIRERVDNALHAVGMYEYRIHAPHQLSGGQKQRVAIAGILAMNPDVIVLDESTAMLDPVGRHEVMNTIKRLNSENGMTVVLITHFMSEAVEADRVIVMNNGSILLDDSPREVFKNVALIKSVGLDVPQVTELMFELRKAGIKASFDILKSDECIQELYNLLEG